METAKAEFDRAVAALLRSDPGPADDPLLAAEFEKLVEEIHGLEVAALENGDSLAAQKYDPAPIESFTELTFPVDPKIKQRAAEELKKVRFDLPLVTNEHVEGILTYFQGSGRKFVTSVLERMGLYEDMILETLRKENLPQDLIYVAAAESAFNPFALSRKGAKGMWQFMPFRGKEYGLRRDRWVDEREDPVKSTLAAARHLKDLYLMFGDWYLAMAAYNCGPGNVRKAIERTGYADFWKLHELKALPNETMNYIPIILATALVSKDPQAYGFDVERRAPLATDRVVVTVPTDLRLVAQLVNRSPDEIVRLNPGLLRWSTPPNVPEFVLNLPAGTKELFEEAIAAVPPEQRLWWRAHHLAEGETLAEIARKFRVSEAALLKANGLGGEAALEAGTRLLIPLGPGRSGALIRTGGGGPRVAYRYRIRSGDTLSTIAERFGVTAQEIRRWNGLSGSRIFAGDTLELYVAPDVARGGGSGRISRRTPSAQTSSIASVGTASAR